MTTVMAAFHPPKSVKLNHSAGKVAITSIGVLETDESSFNHPQVRHRFFCLKTTPPKTIIEPENDSLEDVFPFPGAYSQVPC